MIPHTHLSGVLAGAAVLAGYALVMWAISHKGGHTLARCYAPMVAGLAVFLAAWYVILSWQPDSASHCVRHCFPWGN